MVEEGWLYNPAITTVEASEVCTEREEKRREERWKVRKRM